MPILPSELSRALTRSFKIPGLYRRGEAAYLYRLARRKGSLVEIGCYMGRTTSILLQAADVWGATLTTIDPFAPMPAKHKPSSEAIWRSNLARAGLTPPTLRRVRSHDAVPLVSGPLALVFIDGDHSQHAVAEDLADWGPKVQLGGVLALHDMFYPTIPGVALAVSEWWAADRERWQCIGLIDFTIAFKRVL